MQALTYGSKGLHNVKRQHGRRLAMSGATAKEFAEWTAKAKTLSVDALRYVVWDCKQAMCAMRGHNPERECYYADQAMTFGDELRRRVK